MPDGGSGLNRHQRRRRAARQRRYTIRNFHYDSGGVFSIGVATPLDIAVMMFTDEGIASTLIDWLARIEQSRPLCATCDFIFTREVPPSLWLIAQAVGNPSARGVMMMGACDDCSARHPTNDALIAAVAAVLKRAAWPDLRVLDPVHFGAGGQGMTPDAPYSDRLDAALAYAARGWAVLPVRYRAKAPGFAGWATWHATEADLQRHFAGSGNIGVRLGAGSGGLIDIDLDCREAVELADFYLPTTGAVFGRASKPRSHRLFIAAGVVFEKFSDPFSDRSCLLELRSDTAAGGRVQTVFPPSVHESGEGIRWDGDAIAPRAIDGALLRRACAWLAVGCLLARYTVRGIDHARRPSLEMARDIWARYPALAGPVYRWLGLYNPDDELMCRRFVPEDIDLAELVAMIPNNFDREGWVRVGLAIYATSAGSDEGYRVFAEFSRRSPRHHHDRTIERVWRSIQKSPPRDIGAGLLVRLAREAGID